MKFKDWIIELKIRLDRGNALIGWIRNVLLIMASIKVLFPSLSLLQYAGAVVLIVAVFLIVGSLDIDRFNLMQKEQKLLTSKYNPHLNKLTKLERGKK